MALDRIPSLTYAFPIVAIGITAADEADAAAADAAFTATAGAPCYYDPAPTSYGGDIGGIYDYCYNAVSLDSLTARNADQIPVDGALVLQATFHGAWNQALVDHATVTVTQGDVPFDGALEATAVAGLVLWRPAAAWTGGATYHFHATVDNPMLPAGCGEPTYEVDLDLTIGTDPTAALTPSTLTGNETLQVTPIISLETLACCPDAAPTLYTDMCSGGQTVQFDPALCTPLASDNTLVVDLAGTPSAAGPTALQLYYELEIDGSPYATSLTPAYNVAIQKPFCAVIHTHDVVSGDSVTGPLVCFGSDYADKLGMQTVEPPADFVEKCSLRQCDIAGETWDLESCTPLDPDHPKEPEADDDDAKGCSCAADGPGAPTTLALAGLVGLALRRRNRR